GSGSCQRQIAHPDQIVGGQREGEYPTDPSDSAVARLAQAGDSFEPAEDLLDAFTLVLADQIAGMTSGPFINDSGRLAGKVRGDLVIAQLLNKLFAVVALVGSQGYSMRAWDFFHHRDGRLRFGAAGGLGYAASDRNAVAVLHQHVSGVAELGLLACTLAGQAGLGIGGRLVSGVAAPLTVEVNAGVARIVRRSLWVSAFALEALVAGPDLDQRAVDREMLVGEQALG